MFNPIRTEDRINALTAWLQQNDYPETTEDDITEESYGFYSATLFSAHGNEYIVCGDDEARELAEEYIAESIWAFNASFIANHLGIPDAEEMIKAFQESKCEGCNETFRTLIDNTGAGFDGPHGFAADAIHADGRGHFISSYDGEEHEFTYQCWLDLDHDPDKAAEMADGSDVTDNEDWFIYRVN